MNSDGQCQEAARGHGSSLPAEAPRREPAAPSLFVQKQGGRGHASKGLRGSKYAILKDSGPKNDTLNGIWDQSA